MPAQKRDSQGQPKFEEWPSTPDKPLELLDFEILPDRVSPSAMTLSLPVKQSR